MAKKLEKRNTLFTENFFEKKEVPVVTKVLVQSENTEKEKASFLKFTDVALSEITPRPKNLYRQSKIDRLARSIRNTNNRLIHPIVLARPEDLATDSEVLKAFEEKGIDYSKIKYVIVAGERRFRAFLQLQKEEEENLKDSFNNYNCFDHIPANILTSAEAKNEKYYYEDSNMEARQLSLYETYLHVKDAIGEVDTEEKRRKALVEMGVKKIGKKFNELEYIKFYIETELGITDISTRRLKDAQRICNNGVAELQTAMINEQLDITTAANVSHFDEDLQREILNVLNNEGLAAAKSKIKDLMEKASKPKQRVTNKDAKKKIDTIIKTLEKQKKELYEISEELGKTDRNNTKKVLKELDHFLEVMNELMPKLS